MNNEHTKVTELSKKQKKESLLANLTPDPTMKRGDWVKQTAHRLGVTPNRIYKALGVTA